MILAINFGDNDFINTYEPLGEILLQAYRKGLLDEASSKEKIAFIVNHLVYGVYVLYQNGCEYYEEKDFCVSSTREYLQVTTDQIMLDNEAYEYMDTMRIVQNRQILVVDTNLDYTGNTPVYVFLNWLEESAAILMPRLNKDKNLSSEPYGENPSLGRKVYQLSELIESVINVGLVIPT